MGNLYIGLLHFPMRNRRGAVVATAMTSVDVHDIARSARTYGVARYFVVTPLPTQQEIAWRIRGFWTEGERAMEASRRGDALEIVTVASDLEQVVEWIREAEGEEPFLVATSAQHRGEPLLGYEDLRKRLQSETEPVLVLFGTGWGMTEELIETCDALLPPIDGVGDFNHLSVRAAVAIILDRLAGTR
ncbi:MAG: RNA methyltransferase [Candidatus Bipolaricaulota bacterium]|nr:MAG: RNA methyltransferase [Candidatus Bipolaricaulota bacterium]